MVAVAVPAMLAFAFAFRFLTLSALTHRPPDHVLHLAERQSDQHPRAALVEEETSLEHGRRRGQLVAVAIFTSTYSPAAQVLNKCQNVVPSATPWLSDMATNTPSASWVTCTARTGATGRESRTASALSILSNGKKDHTTGGMYSEAATSLTMTSGATAWTNSAPLANGLGRSPFWMCSTVIIRRSHGVRCTVSGSCSIELADFGRTRRLDTIWTLSAACSRSHELVALGAALCTG
jgi:hypothetical protein